MPRPSRGVPAQGETSRSSREGSPDEREVHDGIFETLEDRRLMSASPVSVLASTGTVGTVATLARTTPGAVALVARPAAGTVTLLAADNGGQSNFPPGQFPAGNPAQAPGNSNSPGKSGTAGPQDDEPLVMLMSDSGGQSNFPPGQFPAGNPAQAPGNSNSPGNSGR